MGRIINDGRIKYLLEQGADVYDIAMDQGCMTSTAQKHIDKILAENESLKPKKTRWQKLDNDEIVNLRNEGLTERQIAERLGTTQVTIHNHIVKMKKEARL